MPTSRLGAHPATAEVAGYKSEMLLGLAEGIQTQFLPLCSFAQDDVRSGAYTGTHVLVNLSRGAKLSLAPLGGCLTAGQSEPRWHFGMETTGDFGARCAVPQAGLWPGGSSWQAVFYKSMVGPQTDVSHADLSFSPVSCIFPAATGPGAAWVQLQVRPKSQAREPRVWHSIACPARQG